MVLHQSLPFRHPNLGLPTHGFFWGKGTWKWWKVCKSRNSSGNSKSPWFPPCQWVPQRVLRIEVIRRWWVGVVVDVAGIYRIESLSFYRVSLNTSGWRTFIHQLFLWYKMNIGEFEFASATMRSPEISNSHFGCQKKDFKKTPVFSVCLFFSNCDRCLNAVCTSRDIYIYIIIWYIYIYIMIDGIIFSKWWACQVKKIHKNPVKRFPEIHHVFLSFRWCSNSLVAGWPVKNSKKHGFLVG